jgi:hypothetical protein
VTSNLEEMRELRLCRMLAIRISSIADDVVGSSLMAFQVCQFRGGVSEDEQKRIQREREALKSKMERFDALQFELSARIERIAWRERMSEDVRQQAK